MMGASLQIVKFPLRRGPQAINSSHADEQWIRSSLPRP